MISVGELNANKNHMAVIKALAQLKNPHIKYLMCGQGELEGYLRNMIKHYGLDRQAMLLGYRTDIEELLKMSDLFVFPSRREGLSVSLMEAMASGLPVVCGNIRGNRDLVEDGIGGRCIDPDCTEKMAECIQALYRNRSFCTDAGAANAGTAQKYDKSRCRGIMAGLYGQMQKPC